MSNGQLKESPLIKAKIPLIGTQDGGTHMLQQVVQAFQPAFNTIASELGMMNERIDRLERGRINVDIKYECEGLSDLKAVLEATREKHNDRTSKATVKEGS